MMPNKVKNYPFSGSTPVRRLIRSKPPRKFVQTSFAQKLKFIGHIFVLDHYGPRSFSHA